MHKTSSLLEKTPPQSIEAEKAIIASMLIDKNAISKVIELINIDSFYKEVHKYIVKAMIDLFEKEEPIDLVTVNNILKDNHSYNKAGGPAYLNELVEFIPTSANIEYYIKIIKDKGLIRTLITACTDIVSNAYHGTDEASEIVDRAESKIFEIAKQRIRQDIIPIKQVINETLELLEQRYYLKGSYSGLASGFTELDNMTSGFQKSDLIIIAARPSMGKTTFCLNITENIAMRYKQGIIFFSLEMDKHQLCQRLISSYSRISSNALRSGKIKPNDFPKITSAVSELSKAKIFLDDSPSLSTLDIRAKTRRLMVREEISLIIIDYLQLMSSPNTQRSENRQNEIASISRSLKAMARELEIPVIAISQLSRGVEARGGDHRPKLSDLRDSGAIEQDADVVSFIYRDEYYFPDNEDNKGSAEVIIAKQRNGPIGTVQLAFNSNITRFDNLAKSG